MAKANSPYSYTSGGFTATLTKANDLSLSRADVDKTYKGVQVVAIGKGAFKGLERLALVSFPDGLLRVEEEAFYGCIALPSVIIPSSVKSIGDRAFHGCTSLSSLTLGTATSSLGGNRICFCRNIAASRYSSGLASLGDAAFLCACGANSFANALVSIGEEAFAYASIDKLSIPEGVQTIDKEAFKGCRNLTEVTLPSSLKKIDNPFVDCPNIASVRFTGTAAQFRSVEGYRTLGRDLRCIDATLTLGKGK